MCADFVTAREAFVGSAYAQGELPRVLFVSLDASSDHPSREPRKRTLAYMRYWEENGKPLPRGCDSGRLHKARHWYWTHKLAHEILNSVALAKTGTPVEFAHIHRYFAHTNSAKCKDAARRSAQGPRLMFDNCREFLRQEIELLRPDVLITQGEYGRLAVDGCFPVTDRLQHPDHLQYSCEILSVACRPVLKFSTAHQNNYGRFNRERREAYPWFTDVARRFLLDGIDATK